MTRPPTDPYLQPTPVQVMRRPLMRHDLELYAAISGKAPRIVTPEEAARRAARVKSGARSRPWSPAVLAGYLGNFSMPRLTAKAVKPEMADWIRRLSVQAIDRLQEAQARLASNRPAARNNLGG